MRPTWYLRQHVLRITGISSCRKKQQGYPSTRAIRNRGAQKNPFIFIRTFRTITTSFFPRLSEHAHETAKTYEVLKLRLWKQYEHDRGRSTSGNFPVVSISAQKGQTQICGTSVFWDDMFPERSCHLPSKANWYRQLAQTHFPRTAQMYGVKTSTKNFFSAPSPPVVPAHPGKKIL